LNATAAVSGTFTYTPAAGTVLNAGINQVLSVSFLPDDDLNYLSADSSVVITVTPVLLTITADSKSKVYGGALPSLTASYNGFVNGDTAASLDTPVTLTTTATAASNVETYPITPSGAADSNYTITFVDGTLTVTPAPLTISADNKTKVYGAGNPALSAAFSGFVNGDDASCLDTPVELTTTATATSNVGTYPITASGAADANYTITFVNGTLTVKRAPLTITADNKTRTYGESNPELTATYSGFVNGDVPGSLDTPVSLATTATSASPVGAYEITASGASDGNYLIVFVKSTLTVGPAALTVSAQDAARIYGAANPSFAVTYAGFVSGESAANLGGSLTFSTPATQASPVGTYPVTPGGLSSTNYTLTFVVGTLTVKPASLTVTANNQTRLYGQPNPLFTASFSGFVNAEGPGVLGGTLASSTAATQTSTVGSYPVTPSGLTSSNYAIVFVPGTLAITPAPLTIKAADKSMLLNETLPALTATYTGFVNGDTPASLTSQPSITTTATGTSPGAFPMTAAGAASANYAISYLQGTLTVLFASATSTCLGQPGHTVLQPIDPTGSVFKQGSTVPVKFRVCDAAGQSVSAGVVKGFTLFQVVSGTEILGVTEQVISTTPDTTFRWDPTAQQWIFNLNSKGLSMNRTYYYRITLMDDTAIEFHFGLR
jgi:hypothetical protein